MVAACLQRLRFKNPYPITTIPNVLSIQIFVAAFRNPCCERHPLYRDGNFGDHVLFPDHRQFYLQGKLLTTYQLFDGRLLWHSRLVFYYLQRRNGEHFSLFSDVTVLSFFKLQKSLREERGDAKEKIGQQLRDCPTFTLKKAKGRSWRKTFSVLGATLSCYRSQIVVPTSFFFFFFKSL